MTTTMEKLMDFYESQRDALENEHPGEWVVIHNGEIQGIYETTDEANEVAQPLFKQGPCMILRIGALRAPVMCPYVGLV